MTFRTFTQHFFAEKCTLPLPAIIFEKSFSRSLLLHLPFNKLMPITYFEGIKRPCNPSGIQPLNFMREREMREWLVTTVYNSPYRTTPFQHLKFSFVRSCRGSKKKVIEKISTASITIKVAYDHTRTVYTGVGVRRVLGWLRVWQLAWERTEVLGSAEGLASGPILTGLSRTGLIKSKNHLTLLSL